MHKFCAKTFQFSGPEFMPDEPRDVSGEVFYGEVHASP